MPTEKMNEVRGSKRKLESADELMDSDLESESVNELQSSDESIPPMSNDAEMDDDTIVISDDDAMNSDCGSSSTYETSNKKAITDSGEIVGDHWSPEEKALLLASIKQYGMLNMSRLASILETKTVSQVQDFIARVTKSVYSERISIAQKRAIRRLAKHQTANKREHLYENILAVAKTQKYKKLFSQEMGKGPIEWWLSSMEDIIAKKKKEIKKIDIASNPRTVAQLFPRAALLISQCENHPCPSTCSGVDYKEAYECLYLAMSGAPPKALSPPTALFIQRSIDRLRNSILDGMYSPEYCKSFGEQVSHIQMMGKETRTPPKYTYGIPPKKLGPVTAQSVGLSDPSQSLLGLMDQPGGNLMRVPENLTWRKGYATIDKPTFKQRHAIKKDIPFGLFCDTNIYEGMGPSRITK